MAHQERSHRLLKPYTLSTLSTLELRHIMADPSESAHPQSYNRTVARLPYRFRFFSTPPPPPVDDASAFVPVHRPPLKYSRDQSCLPLICTAYCKGHACGFSYYFTEVLCKVYRDETHWLYTARPNLKHFRRAVAAAFVIGIVGGLPFGIQCCVMRGTEFGLEHLRGVRDILNPTLAGGLSFGALHFLSVEYIVATTKKQRRFLGRFPMMAAVGAAVGCLSHAAESAFYDLSTVPWSPDASWTNGRKNAAK